jgi:hypothetical protein
MHLTGRKVSDLAASDHFYIKAMGCVREGEGPLALGRHVIDRGRARAGGER